jgi:hypothetical protein
MQVMIINGSHHACPLPLRFLGQTKCKSLHSFALDWQQVARVLNFNPSWDE